MQPAPPSTGPPSARKQFVSPSFFVRIFFPFYLFFASSRWFRAYSLSFLQRLSHHFRTLVGNVLLNRCYCNAFRCGSASLFGSGPRRNAKSHSFPFKVSRPQRTEYRFLDDIAFECRWFQLSLQGVPERYSCPDYYPHCWWQLHSTVLSL